MQRCGQPYYITKDLAREITKDIEEAFLYDFDIIVEEFNFY